MSSTKEKITVMQAYADGKLIEYRIKPSYEWITYLGTGELSWDWWNNDYRIKQEPEYIPFDFTDAESLIGKVVKSKHSKNIFLITGYDISEKYFIVGNTTQTFYQLFNDCTFLDDSPCGKLKQ